MGGPGISEFALWVRLNPKKAAHIGKLPRLDARKSLAL
jgi:hypothetical protein